jgi:hypothetical protein
MEGIDQFLAALAPVGVAYLRRNLALDESGVGCCERSIHTPR